MLSYDFWLTCNLWFMICDLWTFNEPSWGGWFAPTVSHHHDWAVRGQLKKNNYLLRFHELIVGLCLNWFHHENFPGKLRVGKNNPILPSWSKIPPPRTFKPNADSQLYFDILSQLVFQTNPIRTTSFHAQRQTVDFRIVYFCPITTTRGKRNWQFWVNLDLPPLISYHGVFWHEDFSFDSVG